MNRTTRWLLGAAIALLLPFTAAAAPAQAIQAGTYQWMDDFCLNWEPPTGSFRQTGPYSSRLPIEILTSTCAAPATNEVLGVAFYFADQTTKTYIVKYPPIYSSYNGKYLGGGYSSGPVPAGSVAMCILANEDLRLDCTTITWQGIQAVVGAHIPVDSPQVAFPAPTVLIVTGTGSHPLCINCWP